MDNDNNEIPTNDREMELRDRIKNMLVKLHGNASFCMRSCELQHKIEKNPLH